MRTLQEIVDQIIKGVLLHKDMGDEQMKQVLKEWGESIVDECAGNFECTMEWDNSMHPDGVVREQPVLMRGSILAVKNMIK